MFKTKKVIFNMTTISAVMHKIQTVLHRQQMPDNLGWMNTLIEMDELDALKETTSRLARIQFDSNEMLKRSIDLVLEIDSKTYRNAKKITYKYLTMLKINREVEANIFNAVYSYQRQLYVVYTQFLDVYQAQNKIVIDVEKINLILCRHINATNAMTKWRYFDDQPAPIGTWENVCKVIKCAENLAILNTNLFMYDYQRKESCLAALLKQGFMMSTLHKGSYSRVQIQLTEQILKIWATNPLLLNKHKLDKFQFFINTESDKGPERIRTVEKFADYRYWKTTRLIDKIEAYLCAVDMQKPLQEFGLEKMASTSVIVKLFKKLRADWCVEGYERQRRKETRNKRNKLISVSYGLEDICRRLNAAKPRLLVETIQPMAEEDELYDFEMRVATHRAKAHAPQVYQPKQNTLGSENWWLVDESANGFGVDLGKTYSDWIETGKLIGYTTPDDRELFVIAEIKSIRKQANGNYRAGLAVLGTHGAAVKLGRLDQNNFSESLSGYFVNDTEAKLSQVNTFSGLLLDSQDDSKSRKVSLIMPRSEYKRGDKVVINIQGKEKVVEMGGLLAKHHDWVRLALPS
jgi:uncharacterized protein YqgV (UPF0045/DUF77 family)